MSQGQIKKLRQQVESKKDWKINQDTMEGKYKKRKKKTSVDKTDSTTGRKRSKDIGERKMSHKIPGLGQTIQIKSDLLK